MSPVFSIIMTSFNYAPYIGAAIESVLAQSFLDWELIIIDDGSTDESWDVISAYTDPRICSVRFATNRGACAAYNTGLEMATGTYLACLDSDDLFMASKLEKQWWHFNRNPSVDICGTWVIEIDALGVLSTDGKGQTETWFNQALDFNDPETWIWQNRLCHSSVVIRRALHEHIGLARTELRLTPDWDLWIRAFVAGAKFSVIQEQLVCSRQHGKNVTHQSPINTIEEYADVVSKSLHPFFINQSRLDLVEKSLKGFWFNSVFNSLNTEIKNGIFSKALGLRVNYIDSTYNAQQIENLIVVVSGFLERINSLEIQRDNAVVKQSDVAVELVQTRTERDVARTERDVAQAELYLVYRSLSWRLTLPLRFVLARSRQTGRLFINMLRKTAYVLTPIRIKKGLFLLKDGHIHKLRSSFFEVLKRNATRIKNQGPLEVISPNPQLDGQPLVSVVIPCFNYGLYVINAIDSVLAQTLKSVEVLVVDGGSTDGNTISVLAALERPRTRVLFRDGRHLVGDNRNFGIQNSSGRYICCLDADDTLEPTYLEKAVFHLETYGYDIVSTSINFVGAKSGQLDTLEFPDLADMTSGNHILTCAVFRRVLWDTSGGYVDIGIGKDHVAEDWDFWLRLAANGARIRNMSREYLFNYRIHKSGSLSSGVDVRPLDAQKKAILERNKELLTKSAYKFSTAQQARHLRADPSATALAQSVGSAISNSKKTLLLVMPFFLVGGAERLLSGLCEFLVNHGWNVIVVSTLRQDPAFGSSLNWFKKSSSEIYALPGFLNDQEITDFITYLLTSRKPDCLLNTGSKLIYELLPSIKTCYEHISIVDLLFNTVGHVESHLEQKKHISFAMAENKQVVDWFLNVADWPISQVQLVSSGVDLRRHYPKPRPEELVRKYSIRKEELVVGFSGRLSKEKAPDIFVEIARLCDGISNLRFIMTGAGPMNEDISKLVKALPKSIKFDFIGLVDDVYQYLSLYDILVLPSRFDGRPLVVMEALACGVPVVASSVGGMPDLITDGLNGFLVEAANAKLFSDRIRRLAENRELVYKLKIDARLSAEASLDSNDAYFIYERALSRAISLSTDKATRLVE